MSHSESSSSSSSSNYLVHYLRDCERVPFGCIVAIDSEHIGVSVCSPKDKFNKKRAREIALGRAMVNSESTGISPNRKVVGHYGNDDKRTWSQPPIPIKQYVEETIEWFRERAKRYFKNSKE